MRAGVVNPDQRRGESRAILATALMKPKQGWMLKTAAFLIALSLAGVARADSANDFKTLFANFNACMAPLQLSRGTDVTILFSLNRRGGVIGKPRVTHAQWGKDADPKRDAARIAEVFGRCLPAEITDAFGGAIAGRLFTYRLRAADPETKT